MISLLFLNSCDRLYYLQDDQTLAIIPIIRAAYQISTLGVILIARRYWIDQN